MSPGPVIAKLCVFTAGGGIMLRPAPLQQVLRLKSQGLVLNLTNPVV